MTHSYSFGNLRKDGKAQLYLRWFYKDHSGKRKEKRIKVPGVVIPPKSFNMKLLQVKGSYPFADEINHTIDKFRSNTNRVKDKYDQGYIEAESAHRLISSGQSTDSVLSYAEVVFGQNKNAVHLKNCLNSIVTITKLLELDQLLFSDINEQNLIRVKKKLLSKGRSPVTFNKYMADVKVVWNHAKKRNHIFLETPLWSEILAKTPPVPEVEVATPEEILIAIKNIKLKGNNRKALKSAVMNFEVVALWLLMFSMRGMYQRDIHDLTARNLDIDFDRYLDTIQKGYYDERPPGNMLLLKHRRHKTQYPMNIFIGLPPILPLIRFLRLCLAYTHPTLCFNNSSELGSARVSEKEFIKDSPKHRIDPIRIFKIKPETDPLVYENFWRAFRNRANDIHLPPFKTARATFMTISENLGISISDGRLLIGHADAGMTKHYRNIHGPKIIARLASSHLEILEEFRTVETYETLLDHAKSTLGEFGDYLYRSCQIGAYYKDLNADIGHFISSSSKVPDHNQYKLLKADSHYHQEADEFAKEDHESMTDAERKLIEEMMRPIMDEEARSYFQYPSK